MRRDSPLDPLEVICPLILSVVVAELSLLTKYELGIELWLSKDDILSLLNDSLSIEDILLSLLAHSLSIEDTLFCAELKSSLELFKLCGSLWISIEVVSWSLSAMSAFEKVKLVGES